MLIGAKKNYRGEEKLQGRRKITGAKKILLKVYQLSGFLDFNTGSLVSILGWWSASRGLFHVNRPGRSLRHNTQPTKANLGATPPESLSARYAPPPISYLRARARSPSKACGSLRRTRSRRALGGR